MSTAPVHVAPSPMSLGDVFGATFSVFRRRIGAFLALTGLQQLVTLVLLALPVVGMLVALVPLLADVRDGGAPAVGSVVQAVLIMVGSFFVAAVLSGIVALYFDGMMIQAANEATQGRFPTLPELRHLSKGYVGRIIGLYALAMLAYLVAAALVLLPVVFGVVGAVAAAGEPQSNDSFPVALFSGIFLTLALMMLLTAGAFVIEVKLAYVAQVCSVERLSGFTALRRAWGLTKGAFWRTFLYLLVFSLIAGAVQQTISFSTNMVSSTMSSAASSSTPGTAVLEMLRSTTFLVMMSAVIAISIAIQIVMVPLRITYVTVMYGDQLRRLELGPVNHAFAVNMPMYAPGHGYPQAGYGYPPAGQNPGYGSQPDYGSYVQQPPQYGQQPGQPPYGQQPPFGRG